MTAHTIAGAKHTTFAHTNLYNLSPNSTNQLRRNGTKMYYLELSGALKTIHPCTPAQQN